MYKEAKQEFISLMEENNQEWREAFMELLRSANEATPELIGEVVSFLEDRKATEAEARLREQIEEGEQIMKDNIKRELSAWGFNILKDMSGNDIFTFASNAFLIGVSIGKNINKG